MGPPDTEEVALTDWASPTSCWQWNQEEGWRGSTHRKSSLTPWACGPARRALWGPDTQTTSQGIPTSPLLFQLSSLTQQAAHSCPPPAAPPWSHQSPPSM